MKDKATDLAVKARQTAVSGGLKGLLNGLSRVGRLHPMARQLREGVEVYRNIPYNEKGDTFHTLDIYKPENAAGPLPVMVYMHGGGFVMLSKDTHWMMGYEFAHMGCLVVSVNYRLAPKYQYPKAMHDIAEALRWVKENVESYGGDLSRLAYAGESAGANLALTSGICHSWRQEQSFAQYIWDLNLEPKALLPACGIIEVSNPNRYLDDSSIPVWMRDRIKKVCLSYLPDESLPYDEISLASPLRFIELAGAPDRPMPPVFVPCGTSDPIVQDSVRLAAALEEKGITVDHKLYDQGIHAFHAVVWHPLAAECWDDHENFLKTHLFPKD